LAVMFLENAVHHIQVMNKWWIEDSSQETLLLQWGKIESGHICRSQTFPSHLITEKKARPTEMLTSPDEN
jgi:predicted DNA-binding WGR domain protein